MDTPVCISVLGQSGHSQAHSKYWLRGDFTRQQRHLGSHRPQKESSAPLPLEVRSPGASSAAWLPPSPFICSGLQFSSVAQSCPTLCDPMNRNTPGLPVHHQLLEFTQTHVHRVGDAIQPSHPLSSPSHPAPNPSQHQSLFQGPRREWNRATTNSLATGHYKKTLVFTLNDNCCIHQLIHS